MPIQDESPACPQGNARRRAAFYANMIALEKQRKMVTDYENTDEYGIKPVLSAGTKEKRRPVATWENHQFPHAPVRTLVEET